MIRAGCGRLLSIRIRVRARELHSPLLSSALKSGTGPGLGSGLGLESGSSVALLSVPINGTRLLYSN